MERTCFDMPSLFAQLGESSEPAAIARFVASHALEETVQLHEAPFWTPAQAGFLREAILQDAEWAEIVDVLNRELHPGH